MQKIHCVKNFEDYEYLFMLQTAGVFYHWSASNFIDYSDYFDISITVLVIVISSFQTKFIKHAGIIAWWKKNERDQEQQQPQPQPET